MRQLRIVTALMLYRRHRGITRDPVAIHPEQFEQMLKHGWLDGSDPANFDGQELRIVDGDPRQPELA